MNLSRTIITLQLFTSSQAFVAVGSFLLFRLPPSSIQSLSKWLLSQVVLCQIIRIEDCWHSTTVIQVSFAENWTVGCDDHCHISGGMVDMISSLHVRWCGVFWYPCYCLLCKRSALYRRTPTPPSNAHCYLSASTLDLALGSLRLLVFPCKCQNEHNRNDWREGHEYFCSVPDIV